MGRVTGVLAGRVQAAAPFTGSRFHQAADRARRLAPRPDSGVYEWVARWYDLVNKSKDYESESAEVAGLARRYGRPPLRTLLDVACGTGRHLSYLREGFTCVGLDVSPTMCRLARARVRGIRIVRGDMRTFDLHRQFDVVTCLFSSIGYMAGHRDLERAIRAMARHLRPGGVLVIQPWLTRQQWEDGRIEVNLMEQPDVRLAMLSRSSSRKGLSRSEVHFLLAARMKRVRYVRWIDVGRFFDKSETMDLMRAAGLRPRFVRTPVFRTTGILVATARAPPGRASATPPSPG